jgi:hypothetical protein
MHGTAQRGFEEELIRRRLWLLRGDLVIFAPPFRQVAGSGAQRTQDPPFQIRREISSNT